MTSRFQRKVIAPAIFLLAAALWLVRLVPDLDGFAFWQGARYSDLLISHWPDAFFLRQSLHTWHQIPLWNPMILSGAPFVADPLAGLWYPPNWLSTLLPISLAFNLLFWLHLAWAGWGMWRLMRAEGVGEIGSLVAGLAFSGTPKFVAHIGLGHLSLVSAASWTPWVLLAVRRMVDAAITGQRGWLKWAGLSGAVLGLVALTDPRWALPMGLVAIAYAIHLAAHSQISGGFRGNWRIWRKLLQAWAVWAVIAIMFVSGMALPLLEFAEQSTRGGLAASEQTTLSLPATQLTGVMLPYLSQPEWLAYLGVTVLCLASVALLSRKPGIIFWSLLVACAWVLSLGNQTPLYALFTTLVPGANLLRVPPRLLFLASAGAAALAGRGVDGLLEADPKTRRSRLTKLIAVGLCAFILFFVGGTWILAKMMPAILLGVGFLACLTVIWILLSIPPRFPVKTLAYGWVFLVVIDLLWIDAQVLEVHPSEAVLSEKAGLVNELRHESGVWRIFSPSYSLPQQQVAQAGLEIADGVNPLQLKTYRDYMASTAGFSSVEYSVTLPPFPSGDPDQPWTGTLDAARLGKLNVRYVVTQHPIQAPRLELEKIIDGDYVYRNEEARPRAWVEQDSDEDSSTWRPVESLDWTPNQITIHAQGPGLLVLSEVDYPGWRIYIDGVETTGRRVEGVLRGVRMIEGEHEIVFSFRPWRVYIGGLVSLLGLAWVTALWVRR